MEREREVGLEVAGVRDEERGGERGDGEGWVWGEDWIGDLFEGSRFCHDSASDTFRFGGWSIVDGPSAELKNNLKRIKIRYRVSKQ